MSELPSPPPPDAVGPHTPAAPGQPRPSRSLMARLNERGFRLVMVADTLVLLGILGATMLARFGLSWPGGPDSTDPYTRPEYVLAFAVLTGLHLGLFYFGGLYEREPRLGYPPSLPRVARLSFGAVLAFTLLNFVLSGALSDAGGRALPTPTINLAVLMVVGSVAVSVNRWLAHRVRVRNHGLPRILLVGAPDEVNMARRHLEEDDRRVELVGEVSSTVRLLEAIDDTRATDVVLLSSRWLDDLYPNLVRELESRDIGLLQRVAAKETLFGLRRVRQVGGMPFVPLMEHTLPVSRVRFKRFLEMSLLLVTAPLWLTVLGLLCLYQLVAAGRPILFWQEREGKDGKLYRMVKFRTMGRDAERVGPQTLRDDPRIARGCGWLRTTRLDELPQLYNVLRGEMSLVGPRPEHPELTARYERLIPGYTTRYEIPPGITGLAQVHGRYDTDPEYKLGYDLQYLVNWSPLLDLEILARTVWVVLTRRL